MLVLPLHPSPTSLPPPILTHTLACHRDATNYLRDVVTASGPDAEALRPAAAEALAACEAELRNLASGGSPSPLPPAAATAAIPDDPQGAGAAWGAPGGAYGGQGQGQGGYDAGQGQGQGYGAALQGQGQGQRQGGFSLLGWAGQLGRRWP